MHIPPGRSNEIYAISGKKRGQLFCAKNPVFVIEEKSASHPTKIARPTPFLLVDLSFLLPSILNFTLFFCQATICPTDQPADFQWEPNKPAHHHRPGTNRPCSGDQKRRNEKFSRFKNPLEWMFFRARLKNQIWTFGEKFKKKKKVFLQNLLVESLREYERQVDIRWPDKHDWNLLNSLNYAVGLITTVGHGNRVPATLLGQVNVQKDAETFFGRFWFRFSHSSILYSESRSSWPASRSSSIVLYCRFSK